MFIDLENGCEEPSNYDVVTYLDMSFPLAFLSGEAEGRCFELGVIYTVIHWQIVQKC